MAPPNPKRQRAARERLSDVFARPDGAFAIHYACQSFENTGSPSIASIALRNLGTGETISFSIHEELEFEKQRSRVQVHYIAELERTMLEKYFAFLAQHRQARFVHWKMRDVKFGFAALEHRFRVLGGEPFSIHENQRVDLAHAFQTVYGSDFCARPTFENLAAMNGLDTDAMIAGAEEPQVFARGQYFAVLKSTLRKASLIGEFAELSHNDTLVTEATWWGLNRGRVREFWELCIDNPIHAAAPIAVASFLSGLKVFAYFYH